MPIPSFEKRLSRIDQVRAGADILQLKPVDDLGGEHVARVAARSSATEYTKETAQLRLGAGGARDVTGVGPAAVSEGVHQQDCTRGTRLRSV
jgi:hypothetical protein